MIFIRQIRQYKSIFKNNTKMEEINKENYIKNFIKEFFEKMGIDVNFSFLIENNTININLKTNEASYLIGEKGEVLFNIQHIMYLLLKKNIKDFNFNLELDINDYKKKKINFLKSVVSDIADKVALSRKEIALPPMSSYERKIVHLQIAERKDVVSESVGQEPERKIIIKPAI
jgi:spoIIIJ-associated protein